MGEDFSVWKYLQGKANMKGRVFLKDLFVGMVYLRGKREERGDGLYCAIVLLFL